MAGNASLRILRLRTLIDHPRTGNAERAAAERVLDRILSRSRTRYNTDGRSYGARHDRVGRHAGVSRIADMIRDDIALARATFTAPTAAGQVAVSDPIGDAPQEIRFVVESAYNSGIVVTIEDVPPDWGWLSDSGIEIVSPQLRALADELAELINQYNRDGEDISRRFFGRVCVNGTTLVW